MKYLNRFLITLLVLFLSNNDYAQTSLYISKQSGAKTIFTGGYSKVTDAYEYGNVILSKTGPIDYTVTPGDLSIGVNESKTWTGNIQPDVNASPAPGISTSAAINADYSLNYSRPQGSGSGGTVSGTYECAASMGSGGSGCAYHHGTPGTHERVNRVGTETMSFTIYSIKVSLPDTICLAPNSSGSATGIQAAVPFPDNGLGTYHWEAITSNVSITNATSKTANLTLNDTNSLGEIAITFTIEGIAYRTTAIVKSCQCSCQPITSGATFGPLAFVFNVNPDQSAPAEGFCSYTVNNATLNNLNLVDFITKEATLNNVQLSFKKNCETGAYKDITISWSGNKDIGDIQFINTSITSINLTYDITSNRIGGTVGLRAKLNEDRDLSGGKNYIILKKGVTGDFTFVYESGTSPFSGKFNFNGIQKLNIDIVKDQKAIAEFKDGAFDAEGKLTGTLSALAGATYKSNAFTVEMVSLSLGFMYDIRQGNFELTSGNGSVKAKDIKAVSGEFVLGLDFNQNNCAATINASEVSAFGMVLDEFQLTATFTHEFDMVELDGSLKAKHNSFDAKVAIAAINIKEGALTKFDGSGSVKYSGFAFELRNVSYTATPSQLSITANAEIDLAIKASLGVDQFIIAENGTITVGTIRGSVAKNPLSLSFTASFQTERFRGSFDARFAGAGPIDGRVDVGSTETCNFGYFQLSAGGLNVPLGQSGLKITRLGGGFGFNYDYAASNPSCGTYVLKGILGVADVGNVCEVVSDVTLQLGNANFMLSLNGSVNVLRNNQFFTANIDATYKLPENTLAGSFRTSLKVPSNGWIFETNNVAIDFNAGGGSWRVSGKDMSGSMFKGFVALTGGSINMSSGNGTSFTGSLGGSARIGYQYATGVSILGNDFNASVNLSMNSNINAAIDQSGLNGAFGVVMNASGNVSYVTFLGGSGGMGVNATATGNISYINNSVNVNGNMHVDLPFSIPYPVCAWVWYSNCWSSLQAIDFGVNINL